MVAQTSDSVIFTSHGAGEQRRPAIWPWIVMPLVVLVVFCILHNIRQMPSNSARAEAQATTGATSDDQ